MTPAENEASEGTGMMSPDELRALAEALDKITPVMGLEELHHMETLDRAADYLRACAEAKPVAWRVEVCWTDTSRDNGRWRKYADYGTEKAAVSSQQRFAHPGDIESRIVPLYPHPAPAAPQAEPKRELSEKQIADACLRYRHDFGLLDKYEQDCVVNEARRWADAFGIGGSDE